MLLPRQFTPYGLLPIETVDWMIKHSLIVWDDKNESYSIVAQYIPTIRCRAHGYEKDKNRYTTNHKCSRAIGDMVIQRIQQKYEEMGDPISAGQVCNYMAQGKINYLKYETLVRDWLSTIPTKKVAEKNDAFKLAQSVF